MVKAYTVSSSSKEAKESLSEANKGYKEYTEVRGQSAAVWLFKGEEGHVIGSTFKSN